MIKQAQQKFLLLFLLTSVFAVSAHSTFARNSKTQKTTADTVRVLTIGNSFAENACQFLDEITRSVDGCVIVIGRANLGGCSLERHAGLIEKSEQENEKPYKGKSLKELLLSENWDAVTIQQVSHLSFKPESFQPYADQIHEYIKKYAPAAQVYVHQTWFYAPDCPRYEKLGVNHKEMYKKLKKNYKQLSKRYDAPLIKSGDAFYYSHKKDETIDLWNSGDRFHANAEGCYLAGCVWFSQLFGKNPGEITFVPKELSAETAAFLRKAAAK